MHRLAIGLLMVWPLLHFGLVRAYDMNPWKLGGLAMYTAPPESYGVDIYGYATGDRVNVSLSRTDNALFGEFVHRSRVLGRLVSPRQLAEQLLSGNSELDAVVVECDRFALRSRDDHIGLVRTSYVLHRSQDGAPERWEVWVEEFGIQY